MAFIATPIEGLVVFEPRIFKDDRGYFFESCNKKIFAEAGIVKEFVQDNQSFSSFGTLRGLHFQKGEHAQAKLVRVLSGRVIDVAVDLRPGSPTFGNHYSIELSAENKLQLYIPRGFAHGFCVLSETAEFFYKCDNFYSPKDEGGIRFDDPHLSIQWGLAQDEVKVSPKDKILPTFADIRNFL